MFSQAEVFNGHYSREELNHYEQWARRRRAEAVHEMFSVAGRGLLRSSAGVRRGIKSAWSGLSALADSYRRWHRKRATIRELSALSDDTLKDIGLHRGDIRAAVASMDTGRETHTPARSGVIRRHQWMRVSESLPVPGAVESEWNRAA